MTKKVYLHFYRHKEVWSLIYGHNDIGTQPSPWTESIVSNNQFSSTLFLYVSKINVFFNTCPKIYESLSTRLFLKSVISNFTQTKSSIYKNTEAVCLLKYFSFTRKIIRRRKERLINLFFILKIVISIITRSAFWCATNLLLQSYTMCCYTLIHSAIEQK